ncbi:2475_t:CDS:2, partial [Dentiscutata heterogama]
AGGAGKSGIVFELLSILFDEWYTCIDWNDIVKYLNDTPEDVEQKHKGFIPFLAKYIFITSHKPPEEAFNFRRNHVNDKSFTQRDWDQFYRRLDFGSEEDFCNMNWDVKYRKGEFTVDELKTIVQGLNQEQEDHNDVNISNSRMMLDNNYFVQKPVEVIEMTNEYASVQ